MLVCGEVIYSNDSKRFHGGDCECNGPLFPLVCACESVDDGRDGWNMVLNKIRSLPDYLDSLIQCLLVFVTGP